MDFINKVEIKGVVGTVKHTFVGDYASVKFSVCTNYVYSKNMDNTTESTWFNCLAVNIKNIEKLKKGRIAHVTGRLRQTGYISSDGVERTLCEIVCETLDVSSNPCTQ